jgi:hypothetical protein
MNYKQLYMKYKIKYLNLKNKTGGGLTLYHGSPYHMDILEVRTPRGDNEFNSQTGVYLTSNKIEAMLYSIARDKERNNKGWGIIDGILYLRIDLWTGDEPTFKLNNIGYLHEIITDDAEQNPHNKTEYIVKHEIKVDNITEVKINKINIIKDYIKYVTRDEFKRL